LSDHFEACDDSGNLCDSLYQSLSQKIPKLNRDYKKRWFCIFQKDRKRFAYINHRKTLRRIEVWCLGEFSDLQDKTNLKIEPRKPTTGGFGRSFQCRFFINQFSDIATACDVLYSVSYQLSKD
jgi:hypothetical protein